MAAVLTVTVGLVLLTPLSLAAQRESAATASPPLKTPWGHQDLGGCLGFFDKHAHGTTTRIEGQNRVDR